MHYEGLHENREAVHCGGHGEVQCEGLNENRGAVHCGDLSEDQPLNHGDLYLEKIKRKSLIMVLIG